MLVLARPLDAHGASRHGAREQRRVGRRVVHAIMAVAAGTLLVLALHFFRWQAEHVGDGSRRLERRLRMRLDKHRSVGGQCRDGGRGADGGVHLIGPAEFRLDHMFCLRRSGIGDILDDDILGGLRLQPVEDAVAGGGAFQHVPFGRAAQGVKAFFEEHPPALAAAITLVKRLIKEDPTILLDGGAPGKAKAAASSMDWSLAP